MKTKTVSYIVDYVDPDRPTDGVHKTRHFVSVERAREFIQQLDSFAPNAHSVQITKQETLISKERVF